MRRDSLVKTTHYTYTFQCTLVFIFADILCVPLFNEVLIDKNILLSFYIRKSKEIEPYSTRTSPNIIFLVQKEKAFTLSQIMLDSRTTHRIKKFSPERCELSIYIKVFVLLLYVIVQCTEWERPRYKEIFF